MKLFKNVLFICSLILSFSSNAATPTELLGHSYEVHSVSFSNDGKLLASGSGDRTAIVWNTETKEQVFSITNHRRTIYSVAFSKLQRDVLATSSSDGHLILWNVKSKEMIKTLVPGDINSNGIMSLDFSPVDNLLAIAYMGGELVIWNTKTFQQERYTHAHPYGFAMSVKFSPDGTKLVTTGGIDNSIMTFNTNDLSRRQVFTQQSYINDKVQKEFKGTIWAAVFSPDGNTIAAVNSGGTLSLWTEGRSRPIREVRVNDYLALAVAYSLDGSKIYVSVDAFNSEVGNFVKTINAETGVIEQEIDAHKNRIRGITLSADGSMLATASWDETVKIWELK